MAVTFNNICELQCENVIFDFQYHLHPPKQSSLNWKLHIPDSFARTVLVRCQ